MWNLESNTRNTSYCEQKYVKELVGLWTYTNFTRLSKAIDEAESAESAESWKCPALWEAGQPVGCCLRFGSSSMGARCKWIRKTSTQMIWAKNHLLAGQWIGRLVGWNNYKVVECYLPTEIRSNQPVNWDSLDHLREGILRERIKRGLVRNLWILLTSSDHSQNRLISQLQRIGSSFPEWTPNSDRICHVWCCDHKATLNTPMCLINQICVSYLPHFWLMSHVV